MCRWTDRSWIRWILFLELCCALPAMCFSPNATANEAIQQYIIRDNGIRCFVPPCFSWDVIAVPSCEASSASDIDLSLLGLSQEDEDKTLRWLYGGGLLVKARINSSAPQLHPQKPTIVSVIEVLGKPGDLCR